MYKAKKKMKSWILLTIALEIIIILGVEGVAISWKYIHAANFVYLKKMCLQQETLSEDVFPGDIIETFRAMFQLESELVPYEAKCFLRCWLRSISILKDNFVISRELNLYGEREADHSCEREGKDLSNGDECEFAFIYAKCDHSLEITEAQVAQFSHYDDSVDEAWRDEDLRTETQNIQEYDREVDEEMERIERECLEEENIPYKFVMSNYTATKHFLDQFKHTPSIPKNAKCFFRCWYKKHGILSKNFDTSIGPVPELRHHMGECNKLAREWAEKQSGGDECEFSWSFYNCVHETMIDCLL
ncbi:odorant-binding protein 56i [Glossina fuscipes fuscipes]